MNHFLSSSNTHLKPFICTSSIATELAPIRERRLYYDDHPDELHDILADGEARAQAVATDTIQSVRKAMGIG